MFDKKIKILLAAIILLILISGLFFYLTNKKNNQKFSIDNEINTNAESYTIKNQADLNEIKKIFNDFLKEIEDNKNYGRLELRDIRDNSGKIVNFEQFSDAMEIFIIYDLQKNFDKNDYSLFYCPSKNDLEIGIIFNTRSDKKNIDENLKKWEEYIIFNMQNILYPNLNLRSEFLNSQKIEFENFSNGRFAKFEDNQDKDRSLYYKSTGNSIFITNGQNCFDLMSSSLESF